MNFGNQFGGFNPALPAYPYLSQFPTQQAQQPSPQNTNVSWAYVNGIEGARSQIVQPGQTSWMMDNSDSVIYVKAVDSIGTSTLKAFRLTEITDTPKQDAVSHTNYVTRDEFDAIKRKLDDIESAFGGINA